MLIYLIGFMGSGKTVVGKELKRLTSYPLIDMDEEIVRREGRSVNEIFSEDGEEYFRAVETEVLKDLASRDIAIISCGGGVPLKEENRKIMKESGKVFFLYAEPGDIAARLKRDTTRPLLAEKKDESYIREMMEKRRSAYEAAADHIIKSDNITEPKDVAKRIVGLL